MKILIIEDDRLLAEALETLLEIKGFEVEAVYDGEDGAEYAETGVYDLLIMDVMMPKLDGYQVARQVRARRVATPILMLTAKGDVGDRIEGLNAGADDYLTKPFDNMELLACVNALLRRQGDQVDVLRYLESLTTLRLTDYVTYDVTGEELRSYGLDTPELTVTVDYTGEDESGGEVPDTFTLSVSRDPEELAAAQKAADDSGDDGEITANARGGDSRIVYRISEYDYDNLMAASYDQLRHQEVLTADFAAVSQLDITLEGVSYTLTAEGKGDDRIWRYGEEEADAARLQSALEGLRASGADSFTSEEPDGKREIALTVCLDDESQSRIRIELYRCDGSECLAVVDGESFARVSRSDVVELVEAVHAIVLN